MAYQEGYPVQAHFYPPEQHGIHNGPGSHYDHPLCNHCDKATIHFRLKAHQVTFTVDHCPKCVGHGHHPPSAHGHLLMHDLLKAHDFAHFHGHQLHHGQPQAAGIPEGEKPV